MSYKYLFVLTMVFFTLTNCTTTSKMNFSNPTEVNVSKEMVEGEHAQLIDRNPEFKGGWDEYEKYITKNLTYPHNAAIKGIEGKVYVRFIVRDTGKITDVEVEKSASPELDKEAVRLVKNMPDWIPGIYKGAKASISLTLPLTFSLENNY